MKGKNSLTNGLKKHEGLIGQVTLEKEYIYLTEVPENYFRITSGLGGAGPKAVIVVPLIFNEEVLGAVELAFFRTLENFEIQFILKITEDMAATIIMTRTAEKTRLLLQETQQMAEEMKAQQEEELRQNNEELLATQEEMERKYREEEKKNRE